MIALVREGLRKLAVWLKRGLSSRRRKVVAASIFVGGVLILFGLVKYSESPAFCNSCHIMAPYYKAWKNSKHNQVACVECHYPPGETKQLLWKKFQALSQVVKYVTRTYSSKPFAEIDDKSCLRSGCHSTRLLEGKIVTSRGIKFDHRPHLTERRRGRQLKCVSCHSQMVVGKHIEVTYDSCYLCHFRGLADGREIAPIGGCLGCHKLPEKTYELGNMKYNHRDFVTRRGVSCQNCHIDVIYGDGEAPKERCFTCHNQPEKLDRYGDIAFLHDNHVTKHNVACFHCHKEMRHGIGAAASELPGIGQASAAKKKPPKGHSVTIAFDCVFCHESTHGGQLEMYTGKVKDLGLPNMPSPMYLAEVDCVGCHYKREEDTERDYTGVTFHASQKACVKCHGEKFRGIWEETKTEIASCLGKLKAKIELVRAAVQDAAVATRQRKRLEKDLRRASRWERFVRTSEGAHNIYLASLTLRRANDKLDRIGQELNVPLADLSEEPLISGAYCATMCHQKVGVKVPPKTVDAFGKEMPHGSHAAMMPCVKCHVLGAHKEVPLRKNVKDSVCAECHPE